MAEDNRQQQSPFWNNLNEDQKEDLLISFEESFDPDNLISHEEVRRQHEKWLMI